MLEFAVTGGAFDLPTGMVVAVLPDVHFAAMRAREFVERPATS